MANDGGVYPRLAGGSEQYVVEGYTPDIPPPDLLGIDRAEIDRLVAYLLTRRSE